MVSFSHFLISLFLVELGTLLIIPEIINFSSLAMFEIAFKYSLIFPLQDCHENDDKKCPYSVMGLFAQSKQALG
jgi:hypothetical protein